MKKHELKNEFKSVLDGVTFFREVGGVVEGEGLQILTKDITLACVKCARWVNFSSMNDTMDIQSFLTMGQSMTMFFCLGIFYSIGQQQMFIVSQTGKRSFKSI